jgi:hypothetical protein
MMMSFRCFLLRCLSRALAPILLVILANASAPVPVRGQVLDFRDAAKAPPSWTQFAKLVKYRFEEWIAADDAVAVRFRAYLKIHRGASDGPPAVLTVKAWLNPDGTVERVSFAAFWRFRCDAGPAHDPDSRQSR